MWQQNSPAAPKILLLFGEKSLKEFVSIHLFSKPALKQPAASV